MRSKDTVVTDIAGDPFGESDALVAIQQKLLDIPAITGVSHGLSTFGEHALGWMGIAAVGVIVNKPRRRQWAALGAAAFTSHAASVVLKRIVRRPRPHRDDIEIRVGTPSKLSFPSSHATSTTAAMVMLAKITGSKAPLLGIPTIMASRLVLGVHYPTDVLAGALLGWATAEITDDMERATRNSCGKETR
ncbi:phosphatase PAP2 family protein [Corynebacterium ulceribovis]|uniref:phosphatase PAP2 family protein n=1 Tax=Corynebacterium ulceribovis TaxID=487732 RepID=UPI00036D1BF1|nr:phosphatase PAP2 family protein [Corynebacterium ulceribovis]